MSARTPLDEMLGSTENQAMPSRGPGMAIVLTPPHSRPPAKTTWFMRASLDSTGGTGSSCDSPSGWGPGFWRCGTGWP